MDLLSKTTGLPSTQKLVFQNAKSIRCATVLCIKTVSPNENKSLTSPQTCFNCSCNFLIFASDFWISSLWLALDALKASRVFFSCANISRSVWILENSISRRLSCCKRRRRNGNSVLHYHWRPLCTHVHRKGSRNATTLRQRSRRTHTRRNASRSLHLLSSLYCQFHHLRGCEKDKLVVWLIGYCAI